jgi:octaprenyl-diphosphate synthase
MAFQVQDDLLDYTEASETMGKPTGLDLKEHKLTLPLIAALRDIPASSRKVVERLFATSEPSDDAVAEVVAIVRDADGLDYARKRGEAFALEAVEALSELPPSVARSALYDALAYVLDRRS